MLFCYFEALLWKFTENFCFFAIKSRETLRKFVFLKKFEEMQILRKIWIFLTTFFDSMSKRRQILTKTVFLLIVSHIQLNYAFLLFWRIFGEIHRELLFFVQKEAISERSTEKIRKFVFLNMFEMGQILRKIWICLNNCFWSNH